MDELDERQAADALATVRAHQERTRRAARVPWWLYPVTFVVSAGVTAANDFVNLTGAKMISGVVLVLLVVVFATSIISGKPLLSTIRGVQARQTFVPWAFAVVVLIGGVGGWLVFRYGNGFTHSVANAVGLPGYPNTAAGVIYGAAFTALFALSQWLVALSQRQATR
jgi:hypothetical protein